MSAAQRSISQRLAKARTAESKGAAAQGWAEQWQHEQGAMLDELGRAARRGDVARIQAVSDGLAAMSAKRFAALPRVLDALLLHEDGAQ